MTTRLPVTTVIAAPNLKRTYATISATDTDGLPWPSENALGPSGRRCICENRADIVLWLNWSLDGLDQLNKTGRFTEPTTSREAITGLEGLASPVSAFMRDDCEVDARSQVNTTGLWDIWKRWCDNRGHPPGTQAMCGRDFSAAYPQIRKRRPRNKGRRVQVYSGIGPKSHNRDRQSL